MKHIMRKYACVVLIIMMISSLGSGVHAESELSYAVPAEQSSLAATGASAFDYDGSDGFEVPQIHVTTVNGNGITLEKADGYQEAHITITDIDGSVLDDDCQLKVRGNSTSMSHIEKKPFTFKFSKKQNVLGMGKGKKWVLLSNPFDPTLLRNYAAFELAKELGIAYTSEQKYVELWVDGSYRGCYTLYEPVQEGKDRVDIDIESNNGMCDFLLEYEASRNEADTTYVTVDGLRFAVSDPDEPSEDQVAYIKTTLTNVFRVLRYGTSDEIAEVIDVDSFVQFYLLNEYLKNLDFGLSSVFFYYKDGKLYAGPPWDYDLATGNINSDLNTSSVKTANLTDDISQSSKNIYKYFGAKDWFVEKVKALYAEHVDYFESLGSDGGLLDRWRAEYDTVFARNFTVWKVNQWLLNYQKRPLATYDLNYHYLKNWLYERAAWMTDFWRIGIYDYLLGDANGDGEIEIDDVTLIQRIIAGVTQDNDGFIELRADLDGDELTISDATMIQRYLAEMQIPYEINQEMSVNLRNNSQ